MYRHHRGCNRRSREICSAALRRAPAGCAAHCAGTWADTGDVECDCARLGSHRSPGPGSAGTDAVFGTIRGGAGAATSCCTMAVTGSWEPTAPSRSRRSGCCWIAGLEAGCASSPWTRGDRGSPLRSACLISAESLRTQDWSSLQRSLNGRTVRPRCARFSHVPAGRKIPVVCGRSLKSSSRLQCRASEQEICGCLFQPIGPHASMQTPCERPPP